MSNLATKLEVPSNILSLPPARGFMQFRSLEEVLKYAKIICNTELCPKNYMFKPDALALAIEYCLELGLKPMLALPYTSIVHGRLKIWGPLPLALCMKHPEYEGHEDIFEPNACKAIFKIRRAGQVFQGEFSQADAIKAGLWDKKSDKGVPSCWVKFPKDMLKFKAQHRGVERGFADILFGLCDFIPSTTERVIEPREDSIDTLQEFNVDRETGELNLKMTLNDLQEGINAELLEKISDLRNSRDLGATFSDWMVDKGLSVKALTKSQATRWISWMEKQPVKLSTILPEEHNNQREIDANDDGTNATTGLD